MPRLSFQPSCAALPIAILGLAVMAVGIVLQSRGIDIPDLLGSTTSFGVMARLGGALVLAALALFALPQIFGDPRLDRRLRNLERDLPALALRSTGAKAAHLPAVTSEQMTAWQMRLAARSSLAVHDDAYVPERRLGQALHRAAIALIAGGFTTLLTLTLIQQIAS